MRENKYHDYLRQVSMFERLSPRQLDSIARVATSLRAEPGRILVREGTLAYELMVLTDGVAEVTRAGDHVADVGTGDVVGEMAVLTRGHRSSTVTATTDVEMIHITGADFAMLLEDVPALAVTMLPVLAARGAHVEEVGS